MKLLIIEVSLQDSHKEAGVWSSKHEMKPVFLAYFGVGKKWTCCAVNMQQNVSDKHWED
ncbi:MAG: hypothetical protein ACYCYE_01505 [Clostridia bacterium]